MNFFLRNEDFLLNGLFSAQLCPLFEHKIFSTVQKPTDTISNEMNARVAGAEDRVSEPRYCEYEQVGEEEEEYSDEEGAHGKEDPIESLENLRRAEPVPVPARKKNGDVIEDVFRGRKEILFSEFRAKIRAESVTPVDMDCFDVLQSMVKSDIIRIPKRAVEVALHTCCPVGWERRENIGEALYTASARFHSMSLRVSLALTCSMHRKGHGNAEARVVSRICSLQGVRETRGFYVGGLLLHSF